NGLYSVDKGSCNITNVNTIDKLEAFVRFVRLVGGRRNIYVLILALGLILGTVAGVFKLIAWWEAVTGCRSPGTCGLGTVGPPNPECTPPDSTRLLLCPGRSLSTGLGSSLVA